MFWADRLTRVGGIWMLLLAALIVINFPLSVAVLGDSDPAERDDVEALLTDINDSEALFTTAIASTALMDGVFVIGAAVVLYLLFRDRSQPLALFGLVGMAAGATIVLTADTMALTLVALAEDFVEEGGAGSVASGDPTTLQTARMVGVYTGVAYWTGGVAAGAGLLAFGAIFWTPEGEVNPPRWIGALAVIGGPGLAAGWLSVASSGAGDLASLAGFVVLLLFFIALGGWLLGQPQPGSEPAKAEGLTPRATG